MKRTLLTLAFLAVASVAGAQTKNPTLAIFTSTDHTKPEVTGYEIDIVKTDNTVLTTILIAKASTTVVNGEVNAPLNVQPITFGTYTIVVRAIAGTLKSANSIPSDTFERAPGAPSKPVIK